MPSHRDMQSSTSGLYCRFSGNEPVTHIFANRSVTSWLALSWLCSFKSAYRDSKHQGVIHKLWHKQHWQAGREQDYPLLAGDLDVSWLASLFWGYDFPRCKHWFDIYVLKRGLTGLPGRSSERVRSYSVHVLRNTSSQMVILGLHAESVHEGTQWRRCVECLLIQVEIACVHASFKIICVG